MAEPGNLPVVDIPLEDCNRVLSVNLNGALPCSQAVILSMLERSGGRILNQTSVGAFPVAMRAQGGPDEPVGALLPLSSEAGAWITGQTSHIDGGWVIRP